MRVKITQGCAWYKGKEGRVFEVTKDDNHPSGFVYLLVEDINNPDVNWVRYIHSIDCVLVPDEPDELTRLRVELARTQAALTAAGKVLLPIQWNGWNNLQEIRNSEEYKNYTAALASARGTETGA